MYIIGICGSSGSGKSSLCEQLHKLGFLILDCDRIYHDLINSKSECQSAIAKAFGEDLIVCDKIDRKKLGTIVFRDKEKLLELNRISHFYVKKELDARLAKGKASGVFACAIDAPMLFEANLDSICDFVCGVIAPRKEQIRRICLRDQITEEQAENRLNNQITAEQLIEKCDLILENDGDADKIIAFCDIINLKINSLN